MTRKRPEHILESLKSAQKFIASNDGTAAIAGIATAANQIAVHQSSLEKLQKMQSRTNPLADALKTVDATKHLSDHLEQAQIALETLERLGMRQADIASQIGTSQATVSRAMKGLATLKPDIATRVVELAETVRKRSPSAGLPRCETSLVSARGKSHSDEISITIPPRMALIAEDIGVNMQDLFNTIGMDAVRAELKRRWAEHNREAIEDQNAYFGKHGLPLAKFRTW